MVILAPSRSLETSFPSLTTRRPNVLSIKIIENCINLMGVSYHLYLAVQGMIILVAIVFGNLSNRRA